MYRYNTAKILTTISLVFITAFCFPNATSAAVSPINRANWKADEKIVKSSELYRFHTSIKIIPIQISKDFWTATSEKSVQSLYYYFASRSSYGDIPFHYIIGFDGKVFQTSKYSDFEQLTYDTDEDSLTIGVLTKSLDNTLGIINLDTTKALVLQLANEYNIKADSVSLVNAEYKYNEGFGIESMALSPSTDKFAQESITDFVAENFDPKSSSYKLTVEELALPQEELKENQIASIQIKVKNESTNDIFGSKNARLTLKKSGGSKSLFYEETTWDGISEVVLMNTGARLEKDQSATYNFSIKAPLGFDTYAETFDLLYAGKKLGSVELRVKLARPEGTIIEIKPNDSGYLNVRETPPFGAVVTQVLPGEKFVVLEEITGYYKIETKDGKQGWVSATYVKKIQ